MEKCCILAHFSHFNMCLGTFYLDITRYFVPLVLFVTHSYLFKPDHGHHHFSYLSCFSETSKPHHTEMSHCKEQCCRQKQTRFTTAGVLCEWTSERTPISLTVDLLYNCAVLTRCQTRSWWAGWAAAEWKRSLALRSPVIQSFQWKLTSWYGSDLFHSGREFKPFISTLYL